ncbi:hypothetical protein CSC2_30480 [Clostridium zeae]|uniref:Uncharacterized protein n=1 Tax=Clostridium zeae TaxID=2759022 RepID=A0ABQ1ECJ2_9CLOT|nr:hypothetical protein CSC2_30480 [Clostridium zeae]
MISKALMPILYNGVKFKVAIDHKPIEATVKIRERMKFAILVK